MISYADFLCGFFFNIQVHIVFCRNDTSTEKENSTAIAEHSDHFIDWFKIRFAPPDQYMPYGKPVSFKFKCFVTQREVYFTIRQILP